MVITSGITNVSELIGTLFQGVTTNLCLSLVTNNPPTPKFVFLVGFWPLYFENEGQLFNIFFKKRKSYTGLGILVFFRLWSTLSIKSYNCSHFFA